MADINAPEHILSLSHPGVPSRGTKSEESIFVMQGFDVNVRTGFMPPQPPLCRLPQLWEPWEQILDGALDRQLQLGEKGDLKKKDAVESAEWRHKVREASILPTDALRTEVMLRRAHHVLTFIMHIFIHTLPPAASSLEIHIPRSISIPLVQVSSRLDIPPILTYSDTVLYNWALTTPQYPGSDSIEPAHLRSQTTFTGTRSEEHFYLTSARIELAGVAALSLLRLIQDAASVGELLSLRRVSQYLTQLSGVIDGMTDILNDIRQGCDPRVFYEEIRPWFRGQGSRPWIFDGVEVQPTELSGSSAAQSSIIHLLDIFLGIDQYSHSRVQGESKECVRTPIQSLTLQATAETKRPFLERMQLYMPRHHRAFLDHMKVTAHPVRDAVAAVDPSDRPEEFENRRALKEAYNNSVAAVKRFRDAHIRVTTLYIISQASRSSARGITGDQVGLESRPGPRGTGGTDLVPFLKGVRDKTTAAILPS